MARSKRATAAKTPAAPSAAVAHAQPAGDEPAPAAFLDTLNSAQRMATVAEPQGGLQILAGPGSGKTKALTSRVAYLIEHYKLSPHRICVVTFTNKAANEMKERLAKLVGTDTVRKLIMGTFHSVCAYYLRRRGTLVGVPKQFTIADSDDSGAILKRALADSKEHGGVRLQELQSQISKLKSKNIPPERAAKDGRAEPPLVKAYGLYQMQLRKEGALDFDDLLVFALNLFSSHPETVDEIQAVLIDEFQDTSLIQYEIACELATSSGHLTIVGDPDQSIYGWRAADNSNLGRMSKRFPCRQIFLEENYRSTASILAASLAIIQCDRERPDKLLVPTNPIGVPVIWYTALNPEQEAFFMANQVKYLIAQTGARLAFKDFAVLLRYASLSRVIEQAFQSHQIPCKVLKGVKYFDRVEVKDMIAYLQLVHSPTYAPAFRRVVNVPKRGIGEKTLDAMIDEAAERNIPLWDFAVKLAQGSNPFSRDKFRVALTSSQRDNLKGFLRAVRRVRTKAEAGMGVPDLITAICTEIGYHKYLSKTYGKTSAEERMLNVGELKSFAVSVTLDKRTADVGQELASQEAERIAAEANKLRDKFQSSRCEELDGNHQNDAVTDVEDEVDAGTEEADEDFYNSMLSHSWTELPGSPGRRKKAQSKFPMPEPEPAVAGSAHAGTSKESDASVKPVQPTRRRSSGGAAKVKQGGSSMRPSPAVDEKPVVNEDPAADEKPMLEDEDGPGNILETFLESCTLATDTAKDDDDSPESEGKVVISTVHSAKGLEWPVVMVPAVEDDIFPAFFKHSIEEERRLLYVAATRAKAFCSLSMARIRRRGSRDADCTPSPFMTEVLKTNKKLFAQALWNLTDEAVIEALKVLRLPAADTSVVSEKVVEYNKWLAKAQGSSAFAASSRPSIGPRSIYPYGSQGTDTSSTGASSSKNASFTSASTAFGYKRDGSSQASSSARGKLPPSAAQSKYWSMWLQGSTPDQIAATLGIRPLSAMWGVLQYMERSGQMTSDPVRCLRDIATVDAPSSPNMLKECSQMIKKLETKAKRTLSSFSAAQPDAQMSTAQLQQNGHSSITSAQAPPAPQPAPGNMAGVPAASWNVVSNAASALTADASQTKQAPPLHTAPQPAAAPTQPRTISVGVVPETRQSAIGSSVIIGEAAFSSTAGTTWNAQRAQDQDAAARAELLGAFPPNEASTQDAPLEAAQDGAAEAGPAAGRGRKRRGAATSTSTRGRASKRGKRGK